jgi:hypothetical protein
MRVRLVLPLLALLASLVVAPLAHADDWLPHPADASWTYSFSDSVYSPTPTTEKVTVKSQSGKSFTLAWAAQDQAKDAAPDTGTVSFRETTSGLENTDWSSTPPPPDFPVLCAESAGCNQSLASTWYLAIWGSRAPVLSPVLTPGRQWQSVGGADGSVTSLSTYEGVETVGVPAFPQPVQAAKVRSEITQVGALGDPYGSGIRTVWWVYGVGPVKIEFQHAGGTGAATTTSTLQSTSLTPEPSPQLDAYFPLRKGLTLTYRWRNPTHLATPSVQRFKLDQVSGTSARFSATTVSGPIKVKGAYGFTAGTDGVVNVWALTQATLGKTRFPPLGPRALPAAKRRHFSTPFDLMMFGFNPILPAKVDAGTSWSAAVPSRDFSTFGVRGTSRVLGTARVKTPAGTFQAVRIRTTMTQAGFPFGSGTRTSWFAPGVGLVKLVFQHGDGSVSTVELLSATGA